MVANVFTRHISNHFFVKRKYQILLQFNPDHFLKGS